MSSFHHPVTPRIAGKPAESSLPLRLPSVIVRQGCSPIMKGPAVPTERSDSFSSQSPPQSFAEHVDAPRTDFACERATCKKRLEHSILKQPATYVKQPVRSRTFSLPRTTPPRGLAGAGFSPSREGTSSPEHFCRGRESILCPSQCTTPS